MSVAPCALDTVPLDVERDSELCRRSTVGALRDEDKNAVDDDEESGEIDLSGRGAGLFDIRCLSCTKLDSVSSKELAFGSTSTGPLLSANMDRLMGFTGLPRRATEFASVGAD